MSKPKLKTIDEHCGQPPGSFAAFVRRREAEQYDEEKLSHQEPVFPISEWQGYNDLGDYQRSCDNMERDAAEDEATP